MNWIDKIGFIVAIVLPFFNIPLIIRMIKRRSSEDISVAWAIGVWVCMLLLVPSGLRSTDIVWKTFNITNAVLFTGVVITVFYFRKKSS